MPLYTYVMDYDLFRQWAKIALGHEKKTMYTSIPCRGKTIEQAIWSCQPKITRETESSSMINQRKCQIGILLKLGLHPS